VEGDIEVAGEVAMSDAMKLIKRDEYINI